MVKNWIKIEIDSLDSGYLLRFFDEEGDLNCQMACSENPKEIPKVIEEGLIFLDAIE